MKKSFVFIVALLLLLTACQPTPEVDAVRQKNSAKMIVWQSNGGLNQKWKLNQK